ncbi:hypothetical protein HMPREF9412_5976 [Paenibacillus sp. HGF5]|nr:hypothetical protein HMPREF9412_5976 [Paenibacillus sp. HGF5]
MFVQDLHLKPNKQIQYLCLFLKIYYSKINGRVNMGNK